MKILKNFLLLYLFNSFYINNLKDIKIISFITINLKTRKNKNSFLIKNIFNNINNYFFFFLLIIFFI